MMMRVPRVSPDGRAPSVARLLDGEKRVLRCVWKVNAQHRQAATGTLFDCISALVDGWFTKEDEALRFLR